MTLYSRHLDGGTPNVHQTKCPNCGQVFEYIGPASAKGDLCDECEEDDGR